MVRRIGADAPKTVDDLRQVTGLGKDLVRAGIRAGELPGYVVGSRFVIPADAFDDFVHGRWVPKPRPVLPAPATPLPSFIRTRNERSA